MKIQKFEDLECWKEARVFVNLAYEAARHGDFSRDYRLRDQITGAAISVMNNIAEGFGSQSNIEFIRFLRYARRSASEVQSTLYVALDQDYVGKEEFDRIYNQAEKTRKIVDGLIRYLRKNKK